MGLYWSRTENFVKALECLRPLLKQVEYDDETPGILAGVYKRRWDKDQNLSPEEKANCLKEAYRLYRKGWERDQKPDTYRGINAATTALYLGQKDDSREIAAGVKKVLLKRRSKLLGRGGKQLALNYWDAVTLAEAHLLLGEGDAARAAYQESVRRHADKKGNIESTSKQAALILKFQGVPQQGIDLFLEAFKD
jgi:hypothetical protein